jgi:hypothetical protein
MFKLLIIAILLLIAYIAIFIIKKKELPKSISHMVYDLPKGGWRWLWTIWLWSVTILSAPSLIEALNGSSFQFVGFLTIVSLIFIGAFPLFDADHVKWHSIFAIVSGILSQVCTILICPWWMLLWLIMVTLMGGAFCAFNDNKGCYRFIDGKGIFITEVICASTTIAAVITHFL